MKRIHLVELEDFPWFPQWIRALMTNYIQAFHKILETDKHISPLVKKGLAFSPSPHIIDLCSGSGWPMVEVFESLIKEESLSGLSMTLTDLYPNQKAISTLSSKGLKNLKYLEIPLDATKLDLGRIGLRTLISGLHHMRPQQARKVLQNAKECNQPLLAFEISDNSAPIVLWWLAIPVAFFTTFFVTPLVRPMTWQQLVFTYLIPVLPLSIAWDGAVSNARTYTIEDMDQLIHGLSDTTYQWEMGKIKGRGGNKLYLLGKPRQAQSVVNS